MEKENTSHYPQPDRWSYLWLLIGTVLSVFLAGSWPLSLAGWLAPVFMIRFMRSQKLLPGFILASIGLGAANTIGFLHAGLGGISPLLFGALLGINYGLFYLIDRAVSAALATARPGFLLRHAGFPDPHDGRRIHHVKRNLRRQQRFLGLQPAKQFDLDANHFDHWLVGIDLYHHLVCCDIQLGLGAQLLLAGNTGRGSHLRQHPAPGAGLWHRPPDGFSNRKPVRCACTELSPMNRLLKVLYGKFIPLLKTDREAYRREVVRNYDTYLEATVREARAGAKIVVWPEKIVVGTREDLDALITRVGQVAKSENIYLAMAMVVLDTDIGEMRLAAVSTHLARWSSITSNMPTV